MKILAPLRDSSEVEPLAAAGADEFYCGLTPPRWGETQGQSWAHRRDPLSAGVRGLEDLRRIVARASPRPVFAALNSPSYRASAIPLLVEFGRELLEEGVTALIVAEWELLLAFAEEGLASRVHVSSLATCRNERSAAFFRDLGVTRIVLPRHLTLAEIRQLVIPGVAFEAFVLNDGCVFEEGLCATTHALGPFCLDDGEGDGRGEALERYAFWKWTLNNCGCRTNRGYPLGPCGLCALPGLASAGISSLKVVGREAALARKEASVRLAAHALRLAETGAGPPAIREAVISLRGARDLCGGARLCYYADVWVPAAEERLSC